MDKEVYSTAGNVCTQATKWPHF